MHCKLCGLPVLKSKLCPAHSEKYKWDSKLQGFRLKKLSLGSRYTQEKYHNTEVKLTKILEQIFGKSNVVTSFHPVWAESAKGVLLEYDIYIPEHNLLIEYNGEQHYKFSRFFHKKSIKYLNQLQRDKRKKKLAEEHGYRLIIFSYKDPIVRDFIYDKVMYNGN